MNELTEEALIRRFLTEFERHGPQVSSGNFVKRPGRKSSSARPGGSVLLKTPT